MNWTLAVGKEVTKPKRCECCSRRNYSIQPSDQRSEIFRVGLAESDFHCFWLCREHLGEMERRVASALKPLADTRAASSC